MSTTVMLLMGGLGFFLAMGLMRWTMRQSRRPRYDGIQWRGIDWSRGRDEEGDAQDAKDDEPGASGGEPGAPADRD